jgi:hypothetical protein
VAFGVALLALVGAVLVLNATVFGASGFVSTYVGAVARGDAAGALSLPGVDADGADDLLLDDRALAGLGSVEITGDDDLGDGRHRVTVDWTSPAGSGTSSFDVERIGTRFGLFPEWGFAQSPVATVELEVVNDARFEVNGFRATTGQEEGGAVEYALLVPGGYEFGHETTFLTADTEELLADDAGSTPEVTIEVEAGEVFEELLDERVAESLDACTEQEVLFPTGCPFGQSIEDRIASDPEWSIVDYPDLDILPGAEFGTWLVDGRNGSAHLTVDVQSLFDGSIDEFDEDVDFDASYTAWIDGTGITVVSREVGSGEGDEDED